MSGMEVSGWTWRAVAVAAAAAWLVLHVAARLADALWWRPRRLEAHFARQGVRGPPYRFLLGCVREMVALMTEATAKPMSPANSHNALPRVLAFYHYWRKIYGMYCSTIRMPLACRHLRDQWWVEVDLWWWRRADVLDMVRADAAADGGGPRAGPRDLPDARGRVRPVRGAPRGPAARGRRPRQPPRRQVGAPPPRPHARLLPRQPQPAGAARRPVGGGARGAVGRDGVGERGGGGGRGGVVPGGGGRGHHARDVWAELRLRARGVPHAGPADGVRVGGLPQGARAGVPLLPHREEPAVVGPRQGDPARPRAAHRPPQRRGGREAGQRVPRPAGADDQCARGEEAGAGAGDAGGGHGGGVQDVLLRRQADHHEPAHLGHRAPRDAPGVAGARAAGGPRRLRRRRAPGQGAPPQAQNAGDDPERDAAAVPAGGGDDPAGQGGRDPGRHAADPARHGAADPDHGDPPRRAAVGRRRRAVQPGAVRRRHGPRREAPAGVHPVRAGVPDVHRAEPGAHGGQGDAGGAAPAVRAAAVAQVRARAHGAHAALPAVRRARDLQAEIDEADLDRRRVLYIRA